MIDADDLRALRAEVEKTGTVPASAILALLDAIEMLAGTAEALDAAATDLEALAVKVAELGPVRAALNACQARADRLQQALHDRADTIDSLEERLDASIKENAKLQAGIIKREELFRKKHGGRLWVCIHHQDAKRKDREIAQLRKLLDQWRTYGSILAAGRSEERP